MSSRRLTLPTVAALLMFLPGCASRQPSAGLHEEIAQALDLEKQRVFSAACPTPTRDADRRKIAAELTAGIRAAVPHDTLAVEWERLDSGARACRSRT